MNWEAPQEWLANTRLFRCLAGTAFRSFARRRVAQLDHASPARCQAHTLVGLVHRAQATRFGRDHDFRRIRTLADFHRLVPVRTPAELWRDYWQPAYPELGGVTWPGPIRWLAGADPMGEGPPHIPLSSELRRSHRIAALTVLSFVQILRPRSRLLAGRMLLLTEGAATVTLASGVRAGSFGGVLLKTVSPLLRPFALPTHQEGAVASARDVTCILGDAAKLMAFLARILAITGRDRIIDLWPNLTAVLLMRGASGPDRERLAALVGSLPGSPPVLFVEVCFRPEGVLAVEDPRQDRFRLLVDHGLFYEFIPLPELGTPQPTRHGLDEVVAGVPYAVALTSPAGLWACPAGFSVCFSRRGSLLLEWARTSTPDPLPLAPPSRTDSALAPFPVQPPHTRSDASIHR